ncbi:DUF4440 domain-containing protein [Occallatibacter savannae]|uniref:nuclear transport factor 2 family protein n=1 Tax=Occallatibacter savannae TaxID=1002691 RepID=UPI000D68F092|nr:DUF4440 domain-containing protein [Occallatibacter savannae]
MSSEQSEEDAREELLRLELQLMEPEFRRDRNRVAELLAPDFVEFGSSGTIWSRDGILSLLEMEVIYSRPDVRDFVCRMLCDSVALVTYRTVHASVDARETKEVVRSSIWRKDGAGWRICFHQGTRMTATP